MKSQTPTHRYADTPTLRHSKVGAVLIIGGGIAGVTAAEHLGLAGVEVHLAEKEADIGGRVREMGCKAADTCLRCNVCVANKILRSVRTAPNVFLHTGTELVKLEQGKNGSRFSAILAHHSPSAASFGYHGSAATASKQGKTIVKADAIIIATGYEPYDPSKNSSYGYRRVPNVITGVEAERQLAEASRITRVSDGQVPKRVAFIQCVGSRTEEIYRRPEDTDYCSTVCCSYALRIGRQLKYHADESEITVFYMDIQNFGKGFDAFYNDCKSKMTFVRSRPYEIRTGANETVRVKYAPEGGQKQGRTGVCEDEFDLVILSVGIRPPADSGSMADKLGVPLDEQGFFGLKGASDLPDLQREAIFVIGASESPKDIAGSIAQAEAVSAVIIGSC